MIFDIDNPTPKDIEDASGFGVTWNPKLKVWCAPVGMSGEEADKLFDEFEEAMTETKTTSTGLDT